MGAPAPLEPAADGRERLSFIPGDVGSPPYPEWVQEDGALASLAGLIRQFHEAAVGISLDGVWRRDMADPRGPAEIVCHNDLCFENVVSRGAAVALLDWEFAAPGRRVYDLAQLARMCVPVTDEESARRLGWLGCRSTGCRLRLLCEVYGLTTQAGTRWSMRSTMRFECMASLSSVALRPVIRTSPRCGMRSAEEIGCVADVIGGPRTATHS